MLLAWSEVMYFSKDSGAAFAQATSQPTPGHDDPLAEAAMSAQAALNQTSGLPAMGAVSPHTTASTTG